MTTPPPVLTDDDPATTASLPVLEPTMWHTCTHVPACPSADEVDHDAARVVAQHPEQGWNLLCNGVVAFEDTGELLPDGRVVDPHRPVPRVSAAA